MKIGFAGTPEFALASLQAVHGAAFDVALVLTQPDRPAGRGLKLLPSPVKTFAQQHAIALAQPRSLRLDGRWPDDACAAQAQLAHAALDVLVVAAYGLILPPWALAAPRLGCINVHASLLPRWRGAAPIQRAIEAGDSSTGITIMQMDAGLDTGTMLLVGSEPIHASDSTATLHERLAALGGGLIVQALHQAAAGTLQSVEQPEQGATYAHKIDKAEAAIDWRLPAAVLERRIRAFDPFPGAHFLLGGATVKAWRARTCDGRGQAGTVIDIGVGRLALACGDGALELLELQVAGGKRQPSQAFLRGHAVPPGTVAA